MLRVANKSIPNNLEWKHHSWKLEKNGIILPFYKGKGSRRDCKYYRGITLLSCPGKLFVHVLLARVKDKLIAMRRKEQSGFTPGHSTIDRITTLNLILQSRRE